MAPNPFRRRANQPAAPTGTGGPPPFANDPALTKGPLDTMLGHTPPQPDPGTVRPRLGVIPAGASGRANFWGLPQWDELNPKLVGTQGLRLLDEMYRTDAHLRRLVLAAWSPVVAGTWTLEPFGGEDATDSDRQIADDIWWLLNDFMAPTFTEHLHTLGPILLRFGFAPFEQVGWSTVTRNGRSLVCPRKLAVRMPWSIWRWWQDDWGDLTWIGQILPNKADVVIPARELVYYRLQPEGDNWMGVSLLRHAYKHWYLKDKLERLDAVGQERRAVGVPIVYHSPDIQPDILDGVEAALANMHMSEVAYLMFPGYKMGNAPADEPSNQWLADVIKFDSSAGSDIHESIQYHQTAIAASFLTDFLELGHHQVGARATAEVQEDPFLTAINGSLLPPVIPPLNRFIDRLRKLNWASADGSPTLKLTLTDQASLSEIAAFVQQLVQAEAMQVDDDLEDWLRSFAGLPPANADVRAMRDKAREAGMKNAADAASQPPDAQQPPAAGDQPGKPAAAAQPSKPAPAQAKPEPKPAAGKQRDAEAPMQPMSGGTTSADGLQMVPDVPGAKRKRRRSTDQEGADEDTRGDADDLGEEERDDEAHARRLDAPATEPKAAGVIVHAADTGRVLMIQRSADKHDDDDTRARWEFPGGKLDDEDATSWAGGLREWSEETGASLPRSAKRIGQFTTPDGVYRAHGVRIPRESTIKLAPDSGEVADAAWWPLDELHTDARVRGKVQQMLPQVHALIGTRSLHQPLAEDSNLVQIDFDGVIHPRDPNSDGPPLPTARPLLEALAAAGYRLEILTARSDLAYVNRYLEQYGLARFFADVGNVKKPAIAYVDDRAVHDNGDLAHILAKVEQRRIGLDAAAEPSARWFDQLLSHDQLRAAFDGCRDHIETAVGPIALTVARKMANHAANGALEPNPAIPPELTDALTRHYTDMYALGHQTVGLELARQRQMLKRQLDDPASAGLGAAVGGRLARARQRGEHSARSIVNQIGEVLGRAQITGLRQPSALQTAAEQAARGQLRLEALNNTAAMVNDGRHDAAMAAPDVTGGIVTAVLDNRTCAACEASDTGEVLPVQEAVQYGPPNPDCSGGDFCRCVIMWVLASDPAALGMS